MIDLLETILEESTFDGLTSVETAITLVNEDIYRLMDLSNRLRQGFRGNRIDICSIVNAKSGACTEDCHYCAQSAKSNAGVKVYPLLPDEIITEAARAAMENGAKRFCIVTSGKKVNNDDLKRICRVVTQIRELGLLPCATLGLLNRDELMELKDAGLERFHHNIETSRDFFPRICRTHRYEDKLMTIEAVKDTGLSLCSGGIFGMGESWKDRIEMAFELREIGADSIPINFLTPIKGTLLGDMEMLSPIEALRIISLYRLILPSKEIRVCGGRNVVLRELNSFIFMAGANGFLIGNYLTTTGREPKADLKLLDDLNLER